MTCNKRKANLDPNHSSKDLQDPRPKSKLQSPPIVILKQSPLRTQPHNKTFVIGLVSPLLDKGVFWFLFRPRANVESFIPPPQRPKILPPQSHQVRYEPRLQIRPRDSNPKKGVAGDRDPRMLPEVCDCQQRVSRGLKDYIGRVHILLGRRGRAKIKLYDESQL